MNEIELETLAREFLEKNRIQPDWREGKSLLAFVDYVHSLEVGEAPPETPGDATDMPAEDEPEKRPALKIRLPRPKK